MEDNLGSLSAFAVYNNKIPDVSVHRVDESSKSAKKRKRNKNKTKRETESSEKPSTSSLASIKKKKKKKDKKEKKQDKKRMRKEEDEGDDVVMLNGGDYQKSSSKGSSPPKTKQDSGSKSKQQLLPNPRHPNSNDKKDQSPPKPSTSAKVNVNGKNLPTHKEPKVAQPQQSNSGPKFRKTANEDSLLEREREKRMDLIKGLLNPKGIVDDSEKLGKSLFEWLISPMKITSFFSNYWEKKPLHIKRDRGDSDFYEWLISSDKLDTVLRENHLQFGKNVDITSYTDGRREDHNPVGRAMPAVVWDYYSNDCSVRFLNPQTYIKKLWALNASLQEYVGTFVGANAYLTPPDSQGFAPHFDDIEAFILQVEGKKHWKLYSPITNDTVLPRFSSRDFLDFEIGEPILDVILEEGDMIYFPRGTIHQAKAVEGYHSLHLTLSCYQRNSWGDLIREFLPLALEKECKENLELRKGLPIEHLNYMGMAHCDRADGDIQQKRKSFNQTAQKLMNTVIKSIPIDYAVDQLAKNFVWDSLPPILSQTEKKLTVFGDGEFISKGKVYNRCEISPELEVKLIRKNSVRLVYEGVEETKLFYNQENSLEYRGNEKSYMEIPLDLTPGIEFLIQQYPKYVKIDDIPLENQIARLQVVGDLWEKGLIMSKEPLSPVDEVDVDSDEEEFGEEEDYEDFDMGDEDELENDSRLFDEGAWEEVESDEEEFGTYEDEETSEEDNMFQASSSEEDCPTLA